MRRLFLVLAAMLSLGGAAQAASPPPGQGPLWWKISNGAGAVLWVLGIPDGMLMDADWDDASLRRRMASADRLISPLLGPPLDGRSAMDLDISSEASSHALTTSPGAAVSQNLPISQIWWRTLGRAPGGISSPVSEADSTSGEASTPAYLSPSIISVGARDRLSDRLTPEMMLRVQQNFPFVLGETRSALLNGKTWEVALWMDVWNWPRGKLLGNPVTARAQLIARQARIPVDVVYVAALWKPVLLDNKLPPARKEEWQADYNWLFNIRPNIRIEPPEALQQKCLDQVLTQTESGLMPTMRVAAMQAWARGDIDKALKRSNMVQLCLMGDAPTTNAAAFVAGQAGLYIQALEGAFDQPGQRVALIEFDPLLLKKSGVLDHYRKLGYDITTGNGMGD